MRKFFLFIIFLCSHEAFCQSDSAKKSFWDKIDFSLSGATYHQHHPEYAETSTFNSLQPQFTSNRIQEQKFLYPYQFSKNFNDVPFFHGSTYFKLRTEMEIIHGFRARADLFAEHRGMSYGVNNYNNIAVYPRLLLTLDTSMTFFDEKIFLNASVGHYYDTRLYEGLTLYNLESQGTNIALRWKNFRVAYSKIGDLFSSIGLGIDDGDDIIFSLLEFPLTESWKTDIQIGMYNYSTTDGYRINYVPRLDLSDAGKTISIGIYPDKNFRLYGQFAMRNGTSENFLSRTAFHTGAYYNLEKEKFRLSSRAEFRRYNYLFNHGYYNYDVDFRDPRSNSSNSQWGNSVGTNLYPLYMFDRPFSQWAVYTEYRNRSVSAYTFTLDAKYFFLWDFFINGALDLNYIDAQASEKILYPFYSIGGGWEYEPGTSFSLFLSNRSMLLDKHYPTFFFFEVPVINFFIKWNVR